MNDADGIAPAVESILRSAREREGGGKRLAVEARSFPEAITGAGREERVPVIAEIKPTSPTTEGVREDDPVELAREMVAGGASALSVLTEPDHFGGAPATLEAVREAVDVPVLRKDFVLREEQLDVVEADLILLIARFVDDLEALVVAARDRGFQPLVEVHTREELQRAIDAGGEIIGINNRDLGELEVDLETFEALAREAPEDALLVAESGISSNEDVRRMCNGGADALLIGTAIMDGDVRENTEEFTNA